ncbi:hypothetical protein BDF21DRAFT_336998 [Thamnidium elegans]|nr:hypothetical protein BDF21DRAFT_336998 [Thamnidium elegans]
MIKFVELLLLYLITFSLAEAGINVTDISQCPTLSPRTPPTSVHDLRADDIKVIGALGDSITAGFGIMGLNTSLPLIAAKSAAYKEYRGLSYSAGGDIGAFTVPNYIKHYQTNLTGYSVGSHLPELCGATSCDSLYLPNKDELNAAQSGAIARDLDHELDYLLERIKFVEGVDYQNDWKMINIQIGSNDMCGACNSSYINDTTPEVFGSYVEAAVERIRNNIPKVLVNLIGTFNVSEVFPLRAGQSYCLPLNKTGESLCPCTTTPGGLEKMGNLNIAYNQKLVDIYNKYQKNKTDDFTVVYQQSNINITGFPIDFFR